jgi:hypothetical protein
MTDLLRFNLIKVSFKNGNNKNLASIFRAVFLKRLLEIHIFTEYNLEEMRLKYQL